ncbi:MAG: hypothetical protein KAI85_02920 [Halopseudomonas aestusnigri]|nr:hypothetical protein [Halopseudomonas aestusnigri]
MTKSLKLVAPIIAALALTTGCTEQTEVNFPEEPGNYVIKRDGLLIFREVYHDGMYFEDRQSRQDRNKLEKCGWAVTDSQGKDQIDLVVQDLLPGCRFMGRRSYSVVE